MVGGACWEASCILHGLGLGRMGLQAWHGRQLGWTVVVWVSHGRLGDGPWMQAVSALWLLGANLHPLADVKMALASYQLAATVFLSKDSCTCYGTAAA